MRDVQKFDIRNSLHHAIFQCVIHGGAGDCKLIEFSDENHGHVITSSAGHYKWSRKNNRIYCCRKTAVIKQECEVTP